MYKPGVITSTNVRPLLQIRGTSGAVQRFGSKNVRRGDVFLQQTIIRFAHDTINFRGSNKFARAKAIK